MVSPVKILSIPPMTTAERLSLPIAPATSVPAGSKVFDTDLSQEFITNDGGATPTWDLYSSNIPIGPTANASRSLTSADINKKLITNTASPAVPVALTLPLGLTTVIGDTIVLTLQEGLWLGVQAVVGVTLNGINGSFHRLPTKYSSGVLTQVSLNVWVLSDLFNTPTTTRGDLIVRGLEIMEPLPDIATGNVLISGGVGQLPSYGKVGLGTHVTGTTAVVNGGSGQTSYVNGELLIGNSTGNTLTKSTLTAGTGINITNTGGSIEIEATASSQAKGQALFTAAGPQYFNIQDLLWRSVNSTYTASQLTDFSHVAGVLTYTGPGGDFLTHSMLSMECNNFNGIPLELGIFKNGQAAPEFFGRFTAYDNTDADQCTIDYIVTLATNDTIELQWRRFDLVLNNPDFFTLTGGLVVTEI